MSLSPVVATAAPVSADPLWCPPTRWRWGSHFEPRLLSGSAPTMGDTFENIGAGVGAEKSGGCRELFFVSNKIYGLNIIPIINIKPQAASAGLSPRPPPVLDVHHLLVTTTSPNPALNAQWHCWHCPSTSTDRFVCQRVKFDCFTAAENNNREETDKKHSGLRPAMICSVSEQSFAGAQFQIVI